ncbi:unnamed protein product, partial [Didymodactylos carnosus]
KSQEELIASLNSIDLSDPPAWLNPARQLQQITIATNCTKNNQRKERTLDIRASCDDIIS